MGGFLRRVFLLIALIAFGWAGYLYMFADGGDQAALPEPQSAPSVAAAARPADLVRPESFNSGVTRSAINGVAGPEDRGEAQAANIGYNAPETMRLNQPTTIRLEMDASQTENLSERLAGYFGDIREATVDVDRRVSARLEGPGFEINSRNAGQEVQVLSTSTVNAWEWEVRPLELGEQVLTLTIFNHADGAAEPMETYRDPIVVEVSTFAQVLGMAQTAHPIVGVIAGAVSLIIAVFGFARRRRNR